MCYFVRTISDLEDIHTCEQLPLTYPLWGTIYTPKSYGQIGYLKDFGLIVRLTCEETNPPAQYKSHNDPVYRDSALEFFFKPYKDDPNYLNFETNANGAVLTQIGKDISDRVNLDPFRTNACTVIPQISEDKWSVILHIPDDFLQKIYPSSYGCKKMDIFRFNFYKISESDENTHFISLTPITAPTPNFHLPQYFKNAKIQCPAN